MKKQISDDLIKKLKIENEILNKKVYEGLKLLEKECIKNEMKEIADQKYIRNNVFSEEVEEKGRQIEDLEETNKETSYHSFVWRKWTVKRSLGILRN